MAVKMVVFDIAGTTMRDTGAIAIAFQKAMAAFDVHIPIEEINPLMGYKKPQAIKIMLETKQESRTKVISDDLVDKIHNCFLEEMIQYYTTASDIEPLPHVEDVFETLQRNGIKVVLDTGFSHDITAVIMDRLGWLKDGLVDMTVSSDEVAAGRPQPYMIQKAMKHFGIEDPKTVIKIGDTEVDVNEGKNAQCLLSIGVATGAFSRAELEPYEPDHILNDLSELIPIIESI
ncbi:MULTISPECIES: HAD-IA family hydrolase [Chitinophagaceae]